MAAATHTTLSTFTGALQYGGGRPSLFEVTVSKPSAVLGTFDNMKTQCTVSAIPPLTVTPIERQYFGRTVKIPGDMVCGDLSTTIINTEDFSLRKPLEDWCNKINNTGTNYGKIDNSSTFGSVTLTQFNKEGKGLISWTFVDCWPQTIAEIPLSYDTASDIEQFDVTWAYNYYTQAKASGGASSVSSYAKHL